MTVDSTRLIEARRAELSARVAAVEERLTAIRAERSAAIDDDEHDPEGATLSAEWSRAEGQRADAVRELSALDAALERVGNGTYGVCASCGADIPRARLELLPAATLCVGCASRA